MQRLSRKFWSQQFFICEICEENFYPNLQRFLCSRHVGAHTDGHQHGDSIQISINLGKKFIRISHIRKIAVTRILVRVFAYLPSFISQILDFIY